jgi:hypothetical protein
VADDELLDVVDFFRLEKTDEIILVIPIVTPLRPPL